MTTQKQVKVKRPAATSTKKNCLLDKYVDHYTYKRTTMSKGKC